MVRKWQGRVRIHLSTRQPLMHLFAAALVLLIRTGDIARSLEPHREEAAPAASWPRPPAQGFSGGSQLAVQGGRSLPRPTGARWSIEAIDTPKYIQGFGPQAMQLDTFGHPHLVYGEDYQYHAWHDGTQWQYETIPGTGASGGYQSLALDSQNRPHLTYFDYTNMDLRYAWYDGSQWSIQTVDTGYVWGYASLALGSSSLPHVAYYDDGNKSLKYASNDGVEWHIETVDCCSVGPYASLALDASNRPHIAYYDYGQSNLKHAWHDGSQWHAETVDAGDQVGQYASLALDSLGFPAISYMGNGGCDLKYARYDGSGWRTESLTLAGMACFQTSLTLDASGRPHIGYFGRDPVLDLAYRYIWFDGAQWIVETAADAGEEGFWYACNSLALDSSGRPRMVYYEKYPDWHNSVRYAWNDGAGWQSGLVEHDGGRAGRYTSVALDSLGRPHIAYGTENRHELKYAWYDGGTWQIEVASNSIYVESQMSLALDDGNHPHVAYVEGTNCWVMYAWNDGTTWQTQSVDYVGDSLSWYEFTSLALDRSGRPHIAYSDDINQLLKHAWYDGTTWHIEAVGPIDISVAISLALDAADRPHIAYFHEGVRYAWYDGTSWHSEAIGTAVRSPGAFGYVSLDLGLDQSPHVAYTAGGLGYAHRTSTGWSVQIVDSNGDVGWYASLKLETDDHPCIAYFDEANYRLMLARWLGTAWDIQVVDDGGIVGLYSSLALDGHDDPGTSYFDWGNSDLLYARLQTNAVSGHVKDANGDPVPGVVVSAGGGFSAVTGDSGDYSMTGLPQGTYTLTPCLEGWTFTPPTRTVVLPPDAEGQDFTGLIPPAQHVYLPIVLRLAGK